MFFLGVTIWSLIECKCYISYISNLDLVLPNSTISISVSKEMTYLSTHSTRAHKKMYHNYKGRCKRDQGDDITQSKAGKGIPLYFLIIFRHLKADLQIGSRDAAVRPEQPQAAQDTPPHHSY